MGSCLPRWWQRVPDELLAEGETQQARLARLRREGVLPQEVWQLLTELRRSGNEANHAFTGEPEEALTHLQFAWILGVWLMRTFENPAYERSEFVAPRHSGDPERLHVLQAQAEQARTEAEQRLAEQQAQAPADTSRIVSAASHAAAKLGLNEAQTRQLIDAQLHAVGWEADTPHLKYAAGVRPEKGRNLAIAEWPTDSGPADYALFAGLTPVGVVEAKRRNKAVMGSLEQAARYSRGFRLDMPGLTMPDGPWGEGPDAFRAPLPLRDQWTVLPGPAQVREWHLVPGRPPRRQSQPSAAGLA
ncbi:hypothetical protein CTI14_03865 [Methylobacterium radiotolerans]|nr:hypothetical protein CTI14_03865 [Methylobacterium radiotolerans]